MQSKLGNITQLAFDAVNNEELLYNVFSTTESVIDYMEDEKHFKSLSEVLIETMQNSPVFQNDWPQEKYSDILFDLLERQEAECEAPGKWNYNTVNKWFTGETKSIRFRTWVIKICFALKLDMPLSNTLLNKCSYNGLNIRNVEDAIYLYCILNQRPLSAAQKLLAEYKRLPADHAATSDHKSRSHSGQTTFILENHLLRGSDWSDDESFFETFLIPNKSKFIGYASTELKEYYTLKNYMYIVVFLDALSNEEKLFEILRADQNYYEQHILGKGSLSADFPITNSVKDNLFKHNGYASFLGFAEHILEENNGSGKTTASGISTHGFLIYVLNSAYDMLGRKLSKSSIVISEIQRIRNIHPEFDSQIVKAAGSKLRKAVKKCSARRSPSKDSAVFETLLLSADKVLKQSPCSADDVLSLFQKVLHSAIGKRYQEQIISILKSILRVAYRLYLDQLCSGSCEDLLSELERIIGISPNKKLELFITGSLNSFLCLAEYTINKKPDAGDPVSEARRIITENQTLDGRIRKLFETDSVLGVAKSMLKEHICDFEEILVAVQSMIRDYTISPKKALYEIQSIVLDNDDIALNAQIAVFLNEIMTNEGFLKYVIYSINDKETQRLRGTSDSTLNDTALEAFPTAQTFSNFERKPLDHSQKKTTRKAIILMYYITYAYEFTSFLSDYTYSSIRFGNMSFPDFIIGVNTMLSKCKLSPLYPAHQFDWLILRSIKELDLSKTFDADNPVKFINDVIAFSFGDNLDDFI